MHTSRRILFSILGHVCRRAQREHERIVSTVAETACTAFVNGTHFAHTVHTHSSIADHALPAGLVKEQIPKHVAMIIDGNSRWAKRHGQPAAFGHQEGFQNLDILVECGLKWGVQALTLYIFSTENWGRDPEEVAALMQMLEGTLLRMEQALPQRGVRFRAIGDVGRLCPSLQKLISRLSTSTEYNNNLHLTFALSYGSRQDIVAAAQKVANMAAQGLIQPDEVDERMLQGMLGTGSVVATVGEPDLLIRTSGEQRLSNFLLWEMAYTELVFVPCMWPDFDQDTFAEAMRAFARRSRRFGRR